MPQISKMKEFLIFYVNGNNIIIYIDYILCIFYGLTKCKIFKKNFLFFIDLLLITIIRLFLLLTYILDMNGYYAHNYNWYIHIL